LWTLIPSNKFLHLREYSDNLKIFRVAVTFHYFK
jgi:hypothetical protein